MKKTNPNFLNGVPELLILKLLDKREMYGYELVKEIQVATKNRLAFGEGCIYPILHSLERRGLLTTKRVEVNGRRRLYYKITENGRRKLVDISKEWTKITKGIALVLGGKYELLGEAR